VNFDSLDWFSKQQSGSKRKINQLYSIIITSRFIWSYHLVFVRRRVWRREIATKAEAQTEKGEAKKAGL
jgi:hypothetical protein